MDKATIRTELEVDTYGIVKCLGRDADADPVGLPVLAEIEVPEGRDPRQYISDLAAKGLIEPPWNSDGFAIGDVTEKDGTTYAAIQFYLINMLH